MSLLFLLAILTMPLLLLWIVLAKFKNAGRKIFPKATRWYLAVAVLLFVLVGLTGFLSKTWLASSIMWLTAGLFLGLGVLHRFMLYDINPWAERPSFWREMMFTVIVTMLAAIAFMFVFHWAETRKLKADLAWSDNIVWSVLLFPLTFLMLKTYDFWLNIPMIARKIVEAWKPPFGTDPPLIEPGNRALILHFHVPVRENSPEIIQVNTRAPIEKTIGEMFYYLLYRQNVERNTENKVRIEISAGNSREHIYGWQFYQKGFKKWWQFWKDDRLFLDPLQPLLRQPLKSGDVIFVSRVVTW
jgi:Type VI secretion system, TssN